MRDIFIADAHLVDPEDPNYRRLLSFFEEQRGRIRTLFLLGDIFEFWMGYRHTVFAPYVPLLEALRRLRESGTEIVYVEGNHDFHMGPYFENVLGCRILPDGGPIDLDGRKVFIGHGDLVNPDDRGYRVLRRFLRSRTLRRLKNLIPPDWAWAIARWAGRRSRGSSSERRAPVDMLMAHARELFAEGYCAVVTGHFHEPSLTETESGTMVALGDWIERYSYAVFENGRFELRSY
jgi:UDP-2,3-diacylglucosamine hydrolase